MMMMTTGKLRIVSKLHSLISVILICLLENGSFSFSGKPLKLIIWPLSCLVQWKIRLAAQNVHLLLEKTQLK